MKNREPVLKKLDSIESKVAKLSLGLSRGDREGCFQVLNEIREIVEQAKGYVESEPISGYELNHNS